MGICIQALCTKKNISLDDLNDEKSKYNSIFEAFAHNSYYSLRNIPIPNDYEINNPFYDQIVLSLSFKVSVISDDNYKFNVQINNNRYKNNDNYIELGETEDKIYTQNQLFENFIKKFKFNYFFHKDQFVLINAFQNNKLFEKINIALSAILGTTNNSLIIPIKNDKEVVIGQLNIDANESISNMYYSNLNINLSVEDINQDCTLLYTISNKYGLIYKSNDINFSFHNGAALTYSNVLNFPSDLLDNEIKFDIFERLQNEYNGENEEHNDEKNVNVINNKCFLHMTKTINKDNIKNKNDIIFDNYLANYENISEQDKELLLKINKISKGKLSIKYTETKVNSMMDYIKNSMKVGLIIAIDYSNESLLPLTDKNSLHYIEDVNSYQKIIKILYERLCNYNDKKIAMFSIGGNKGDESDCFLIKDISNTLGKTEILSLYKTSLSEIVPRSKSVICQLLKEVSKMIRKELNEGVNKYYTLVILLNEDPSDINELPDEIYKILDIPLSLVFLGMNDKGKYEELIKLNKRDKLYSNYTDNGSKRDILKYIQYKENECYDEILKDIPREIVEFFEIQKNLKFNLLSD